VPWFTIPTSLKMPKEPKLKKLHASEIENAFGQAVKICDDFAKLKKRMRREVVLVGVVLKKCIPRNEVLEGTQARLPVVILQDRIGNVVALTVQEKDVEVLSLSGRCIAIGPFRRDDSQHWALPTFHLQPCRRIKFLDLAPNTFPGPFGLRGKVRRVRQHRQGIEMDVTADGCSPAGGFRVHIPRAHHDFHRAQELRPAQPVAFLFFEGPPKGELLPSGHLIVE